MRNHSSRVRTRNHSWRNKHFLRRKYSAGPENVAARQARTPHEPRPRRRTLPTNPAQRHLELNISQSVGRGRRAHNRLVIRRLDDSDKVAGAEHRILTDNFAAKISYLLVYLVQAIGVAVQCPTSLRS